MQNSRAVPLSVALALLGCAGGAGDATAVDQSALLGAGAAPDENHANDFVGSMNQTCNPDDTPLNPLSAQCHRIDATTGLLRGSPGQGSGTLITPTIVVYSAKYYAGVFADHYLTRLSHFQGPVSPGLTIPWSLGPDVRDPVSVHILTGFFEHRRARMGLSCVHPARLDGSTDISYVIPPPADQGTPYAELEGIGGYACRFPTYGLYAQSCLDPLAADDVRTSTLLYFTLRERIGRDRGDDVMPARPLIENPPDAEDPFDPDFWNGRVARVFDYGSNDFGPPGWGVRGTGDVTIGATFANFRSRTPAGEWVDRVRGFTATTPPSVATGGSAYATIVDAAGRDGIVRPQVLQIAGHGDRDIAGGGNAGNMFLGDTVLRDWLDPDGDGFFRGELDAYTGPADEPLGPTIPGNCSDSDQDCLGANDNCDPIYNPDQLDSDGDGIGDECDLCPDNWDLLIPDRVVRGVTVEPELPLSTRAQIARYPARTCRALRPAAATGRLHAVEVGDVIGAACAEMDQSTSRIFPTDDLSTPQDEHLVGLDFAGSSYCQTLGTVEHVPGTDFDGDGDADDDDDGVPFLCDNCPFVSNPARSDGQQPDCDGNGVGDACDEDDDRDGISNGCDVCPFVADSALNCNREAEDARGLPAVPDSCDPTPCADVEPSTYRRATLSTTRISISNARLTGRALVSSAPDAPPDLDLTGVGDVGFRFCPCDTVDNDLRARLDCADIPRCLQYRSIFGTDEVDLYSTTTGAWQPMAIADTAPAALCGGRLGCGEGQRCDAGRCRVVACSASSDCATVGGDCVLGSCRGEIVARFSSPTVARAPDVVVDWNFEFDPAAASTRASLPHGIRARGVVWTQVRDTLLCALGEADENVACERRAAHYWSGQVQRIEALEPSLVDGTALIPWPAPERVCPFCGSAFPGAYVGTICPIEAFCDVESWVQRMGGIEVPIADQVSLRLGKSLLDPIVGWTVANEPREMLEPTSIRMVGRAFDSVVSRVTLVGTKLGLMEEVGQQLPKPPTDQLRVAAAAYAAPAPSQPTPTRGVILLGNDRQLVTFGGDPAERQRLTFTDLDAGEETSVYVTGSRPQDVLGAARHLTRPLALVVDRVAHHRRPMARVLLVDLDSGVARQLASVPWLGAFDRHSIVAMEGGDFALIASSSRSHRHVLLRLRLVGEGIRVVAFAAGAGEVLSAPSGSLEGVSLAVRRPGRPWDVLGYRLIPSRIRPRDGFDAVF